MKVNIKLWIITGSFAVLAGFSNLVFAYTVRQVVDFATSSEQASLMQILQTCTILLLGTVAVNYLKQLFSAILVKDANYRMKDLLFRNAGMRLKTDHDYISVLTNDISTVSREYYLPIIDLIHAVSMFVFAAGSLLLYNWIHGSVMILITGLSIGYSLLQKKQLADMKMHLSKDQESYTRRVREFFNGLTVIVQSLALDCIAAEHNLVSSQVESSNFKYAHKIARLDAYSTIVSMTMFMMSFALGALFVNKGVYTIGMMMAAIQLVNNIVSPMRQTIQSMNYIHGSRAVYTKLCSLLKVHPVSPNNPDLSICIDQIDSIEIRNLHYSFDQEKVLHNLAATFHCGKKYAIVGSSGSGKSTLLNLMAKNIECHSDQIFINQIDINQVSLDSLRSCIALMNQNIYVFGDTLTNNITLYANRSDDRLNAAVASAGLYDYVASLPDGLDHQVTIGGDNLSGGQKQRLALARVLYRNTKVVLLDEAFAALDPETSSEVLQNLMSSDVMLIAVFHRYNPTVLKKFDEILFLRNGSIVEKGDLKSLINHHGFFYQMYRLDNFSPDLSDAKPVAQKLSQET